MIGSLISAGASLLGGLISSESQGDATSATLGNAAADRLLQQEFAKKGIRWRVRDAQAAGIHPLYALGANLPTYSPNPIHVGADTYLGAGLQEAGQDIGRAVDAQRTSEERQEVRLAALSVERAELENDLLRSQIARLNQQTGPAYPGVRIGFGRNPVSGVVSGGSSLPNAIPGQGDLPVGSGIYSTVPAEISTVWPGHQDQKAGVLPETQWHNTVYGLAPSPNLDAIEDADVGNPGALAWWWRNGVLPTFGAKGSRPADYLLPDQALGWRWSPIRLTWVPYYRENALVPGLYYAPREDR